MYLNPNFPTFFANPFRAEGESLNVPLFEMRQEEVVAGRLTTSSLVAWQHIY